MPGCLHGHADVRFARFRRVFRLRKGGVRREKKICVDQSLNALDEPLAQQYQSTLGNLSANEAVNVRTRSAQLA